ncbi:MAG TPA: hypothetical protein VFX15_02970 [Actinomycetes bacterium]|nr:hypothetical protein [Actinomycetes bacterium]
MSPEQLITTGSGILILAAIVIAFYTDRVLTKSNHEASIKALTEMWADRFADERAEKEAWKAQAQQLAPAVAEMAEELEAANARDEAWKTAFLSKIDSPEGAPDRRQR